MEFNELIRERFSCRSLSDREIPHESMNRIFEAARLAPTAVNKQPFKVWAIESPDARAKLAETTSYTFGAGVFLVIGSKADEAWVRPDDDLNFADVDAAIAATHIMLAIHNEGLRATWVGKFNTPKLKELFPVMEGYNLIALFPVGYPTEKGVPSPRHKERKSAWTSCRCSRDSKPHTKIPTLGWGFLYPQRIFYFVKLNARLPG